MKKLCFTFNHRIYFTGIKVYTSHLTTKRRYTIDAFTLESAGEITFERVKTVGDKKIQKMTSVANHFRDEYRRNVNPNYPCVLAKVSTYKICHKRMLKQCL